MKRFIRLGLFTLGVLAIALLILVWLVRRGGVGAPTLLPDAPAPITLPLVETAEPLTPAGLVPPQAPLDLPPGFAVGIYSQGLQDPRMLAVGPDDQLYVAERGAGRILRLPDRDGDHHMDGSEVAADGLNQPSSLAFYQDGSLYVGETTQVLRLRDPDGDGYYQERTVIVADLPEGGHNTRTVLFSPDWRYLFVSVGSSCNICLEDDDRRAAILRFDPDGSQGQVYAWGLRNAVGIVFHPGTDELWATNNGRDWLGDNLPPETVYRIAPYQDHGWPYCHSGRIIDPDYGSEDACDDVVDPVVEIQAHSAPLGLTFIDGAGFPAEYQGDLLVALHGSWNRTQPTGYKVVRVPIDADGTAGAVQDFATGWLQPDGDRWGRPVDLLGNPGGGLYVSDDMGGNIFLILYTGD